MHRIVMQHCRKCAEMLIMGVETNLDFQYRILKNPEFCEGKADTGFIERILRLD